MNGARWVRVVFSLALTTAVVTAQDIQNVNNTYGVNFVHEVSPATGNMAGGMAWLDVDGDWDDDLLLTSASGPHTLMRWDGADFTDISLGSGLGDGTGTFGLAVGDYDDDGLPDVYFTQAGPNRLLHNDGNGTFSDVTAQYGIDGGAVMSTSASWADFDRDGDLDLYVGNYISGGSVPFKEGSPNHFFVNEGTAQAPVFVDRAVDLNVQDLGVFGEPPEGLTNPNQGQPVHGACLSVSTLDYDFDGDPDILVGNDFGMFTLPNRLYRNDTPPGGPLVFADVSEATRFADFEQFNMGINGADFDGDGDWDLYLSNLGDNALLAREADGTYTDVAPSAGPVDGTNDAGTHARTSWDTVWFDCDNDGWEDLFVANGYVPGAEDFVPTEIESPNTLWHNNGDGTFDLISADTPLDNERLGRGANFTDLQGDGNLELFVENNGMFFIDAGGGQIGFAEGAKSFLYSLTGPEENHWVEFRLRGTRSNAEALGAHLILAAGGRRQLRQIRSDGVYLSTPSRLVHFGLGDATIVDKLLVRWPSGTHQELHELDVDRVYRLIEPDVVLAGASLAETRAGAAAVVQLANLADAAQGWTAEVALTRNGTVVQSQLLSGELGPDGRTTLRVPVTAGDADELSVTVTTSRTGAEDGRRVEL